jgi:hypothetical protein
MMGMGVGVGVMMGSMEGITNNVWSGVLENFFLDPCPDLI